MKYPGFVGGSYQSQAVTADNERTINFYVDRLESEGATTQTALFPTPGFYSISPSVFGGGPGRAHFWESQTKREFAIVGAAFIEIFSDGSILARGAVANDGNPATICSNGDGGGQLFVTAGGEGYYYNLSTDVLTNIAALSGKATMGDQLDGYFLCLDAATSTFYVSALLDGSTWTTGTQFAQRTLAADPWISMKVSNRFIWLLGSQTSEAWFNAGTFPFPFTPHPSGVIPYGCAAQWSATVANGVLRWIGQTATGLGMVLEAAGFSPQIVSTPPMQKRLEAAANLAATTGEVYQEQGHTFYLLRTEGEETTLCYDSATQVWTERGTWYTADNEYRPWRAQWHALAFGEHRWLDAEGAALYRSDLTYNVDINGDPIRRLRRAPTLQYENQRLFFSAFELDVENGIASTTGQGSNPQVMLRFSNDGGWTWSSEYMRPAGKIGEYSTRVRWNRLGQGRRRAFEIVMSDPQSWRVLGAYVTMSQAPQRQAA